MRLFEWQSKDFSVFKSQLPGFVNYLAGVWQNRLRYKEDFTEYSEEDQLEEKIQRQRFFDFTIDGKIAARNYVGMVQYEDIRIEVYPKIFSADEKENTTKWQLNLLFWLSYCRKISFPFSLANTSAMHFDNFLELLIYIFAHHTHEIISHQPYQAYQLIEEEIAYLKGRLSFEQYIRQNLSTGRWQNFQSIHEPFLYDNLFNRIIKYVTRRLAIIAEDSRNKTKLDEILFVLHEVTDLPCLADDCDKVRLNPLYEDHQQVLAFCKLFLTGQVINLDTTESKNCCFLVPMEYIFEDFLFRFMSDMWPHLNIRSQSTDYLAHRGEKEVFLIRNDMYIQDTLIIDAKYKKRPANTGLKAGINQSDIYQMVSYAMARNCSRVLLLYPVINEADNDMASFKVPSHLLNKPICIEVRNVDITFENIAVAGKDIRGRICMLKPVFGGP